MDAFVHASGDGFGNTAPLRSDTGAIDMDAISQVAHVTQGAGKLTRKEKKHAKREMKRRKKEAKKAEKEAKKTYSSIKSQLKDRDKELSDKMADARKKRDSAKDVVNYIGYNKMYQDGICEVEEGMFSSSIAFDDTSYHSVRDEQQKAMFSAITRLYDQFGADTLVQMSVINTPLLKEEVGHRKFFDPERQANDAARNDAQVFNNILNDKVKEGVSNIRRNRYLTYSVTADTAEDAARQLSRIEVESSRILNSIGSKAHLMNGTQRLSVIHSLLNPYKPFLFDYQRDISAKRLQTTKDCIAPTQIDFRPDGHYNDCVKLDNGVYAQVLVMKKFGSELSDRALADMADLPIPMAITWYVQPMDKSKAINYVRTRSAWIDKEIIEEQRSAVNKGYDFSILPQELKYSKDGKVTKKQLLDADGNPVTAETEFVPEDTYGTVDVTFTFDGSLLKDNTPVVAFESLSYKDKEIASHSDIEDEDQTVTMHTSEIGTTATDKLDGDKTVIADAESTVTDKVEYDHVLTGKAYTMAGILMDAKTGLPVLTGEGAKKYTEDDLTKFTSGLMNVLGFQSNTYSIKVKDKDWGNGAAIVKNADGSYTYDASERTENKDGTWTVKTDTQTLTEQEDGTWKLTGLEGSGSATADGGTSFVRNIEETYKADEVEVTDNGIDWSNAKKLPTASIDLAKVKAYAEENKDLLSCLVYKTAEFTPEKESGSIDMDYTFNSNDVIDRLSGETKNLVVFEVMFKGSIENASDETPVSIVASECDKDNEGQTVKLAPSTIGTTATDKSDGDHELMAGKDAVITDEVKYEGLIPGKEYTLHATLMDKKTGEPLKVADKGVTAELKFTPNSESGTVSINLGEFDATSLDGHTLVVFEELTKQSDIDGKATDVTVAEHKDINDEGQSVTVTSTPAGSTYGKTGVDMTNIAIAIGILLIAAGCATAYGIKSRKTTKGDADENAEDNTEA